MFANKKLNFVATFILAFAVFYLLSFLITHKANFHATALLSCAVLVAMGGGL